MFIDQKKMKLKNLKKVLSIIAEKTQVTRKEIADKTGLSLMSISKIVEELYSMGLVAFHDEKNDNRYGRKAELVTVDKNGKYILIIDLTQNNPVYAVLNLEFDAVAPFTVYRYDSGKSYNENINKLFEQTQIFLKTSKISGEKIMGIGVCVPGPYIEDDDRCINNRIKGLQDIKLKKKLKSYFNNEVIFIDEDVKLAATANVYYMRNIEKKIIMYLYLGEGVGGTVIINGNPMRGLNCVAGDAGQLLNSSLQSGKNYENFLSLTAVYNQMTDKTAENLNGEEMTFEILQVKRNDSQRFEKIISFLYERLTELLYNIFWIIDPHIFIIECEYLREIDENYPLRLNSAFDAAIGNQLPAKPQIICSARNIKDCYRGAGIEILHKWLNNQIN